MVRNVAWITVAIVVVSGALVWRSRSMPQPSAAVSAASGAGSPPAKKLIKPREAQQAVRRFEHNPKLAFSSIDYKESPTEIDWLKEERYELRTIEGAEWTVDAVSGEVTSATHTGWPRTAQKKPYGKYNKSQCRAKALSFARTSYRGFDSFEFELDEEEWTSFGWRFHWQQYVEYHAWTLNGVEVSIDPRNGAIEMYVSSRAPVGTPRKPAITGLQAVEFAARAGKLKSVTRSDYRLQVDPDNTTYYQIEIDGIDRTGREVGYLISVDAISGECRNMIVGSGPSPA